MTVLNTSQQSAIQVINGPMVITAGPGTGKTTVLTYKILELLKNSIPPEKILTLTFTKKAAKEIQDRIAGMIKINLPWIGTFHGLGNDISTSSNKITFNIISEEKKKSIIQSTVKSLKIFPKTPYRELVLRLSKYKQELPFNKNAPPDIRKLYKAYTKELKSQSLKDFDDILIETYFFLKKTKKKINFSYILIDEFQDTNTLQYEIIKLINTTNNICIIGDPLQSIYAFQGAVPAIFDSFKRDFPSYHEIKLDTNYRSDKNIILTSRKLFPKVFTPRAFSVENGSVRLVKTLDPFAEANFITHDIRKKIGAYSLNDTYHEDDTTHISFKDIAVLYRTHYLSSNIKKALAKTGVHFQVAGGGSLYDEPEIQDIIKNILETASVNTQKKFEDTVRPIINQLLSLHQKNPDKLMNIKMFEGLIIRFASLDRPFELLQLYLRNIEQYEYFDTTSDSITLSTIHSAKGLEFDHVYLCGFNLGDIPYEHKYSSSIDEERRLLYVALTRAKKTLTITYNNVVSPFFNEINNPNIDHLEDPYTNKLIKRRQKSKLKKSQLRLF